jgi:hypothetical protein
MNHASTTLPGTPERLEEIRRLCREAYAALGPARRDDLLQLWITQGMSPAQRLDLTRMLCNAAIAFDRRNAERRRKE